jgi:hypothetical protein
MAWHGDSRQGIFTMQFEKSADTKVLEHLLSTAAVGDTITYDAMSKALGRDVRKFALNALRSARGWVLREKKFVFEVDANVGYTRLNDGAIVKTSALDRKRISRIAKRSLTKLSVVDFAKLDDESKKTHIVFSAQMGAVAMFASKSALTKIESKINNGSQSLPIGETLRMFTE